MRSCALRNLYCATSWLPTECGKCLAEVRNKLRIEIDGIYSFLYKGKQLSKILVFSKVTSSRTPRKHQEQILAHRWRKSLIIWIFRFVWKWRMGSVTILMKILRNNSIAKNDSCHVLTHLHWLSRCPGFLFFFHQCCLHCACVAIPAVANRGKYTQHDQIYKHAAMAQNTPIRKNVQIQRAGLVARLLLTAN